jgi:hypothetical protein
MASNPVITLPLANIARLANSARTPTEWPFPWLQEAADGRHFNEQGSIEAPALGVQGTILEYEIPDGFSAAIHSIMRAYIGSGFIEGSGSILWDLDVDRELGALPIIGYTVPSYAFNKFSLGNPIQGPWKLPGPIIIDSGIIRLKATSISDISVGAPNYMVGAILGWIYPSS